jgi:hypothetical protein
MSRDASPGRSRTPSPRSERPIQDQISLLEKLDKLADDITNDLQASPRSQLASKMDASVKNTQLIITTMREKMQSIEMIQAEDRETLAAISSKQDKMNAILEDIYEAISYIVGRIDGVSDDNNNGSDAD